MARKEKKGKLVLLALCQFGKSQKFTKKEIDYGKVGDKNRNQRQKEKK